MRWKRIVILVMLVSAFLWEFIPVQVIVWDGGFDLTVTVSSNAGPLRSVSCQAFGHRDSADFAVEHLLTMQADPWSTTVEPFTGAPVTVFVPLSGHVSMCGRELSRMQFRYLAVIGQLHDGRRVGKVMVIPDSRVAQTLSVSFP